MFRGVSLRTLALLAFGPMLMDLLNLCFLFWMNLNSARMGIPPRSLALIGILLNIGYVTSAWLSSLWTTPARAKWMVPAAAILTTSLGTVSMLCHSFTVYLAVSLFIGIAVGQFFAPYQVSMCHVRPFRTLAWTIVFYNVSWGAGASAGPLLSGWLGTWSVAAAIGTAWVITLFLVVLFLGAHIAREECGAEKQPEADFASTRVMRLAAYLATSATVTLLAGLGMLWPALGTVRGLTDREIALGIFLMFLPIPVLTPFWAAIRRKIAGPWLFSGLMLACAAGFAAIPFTTTWLASVTCLGTLGSALSGVYFFGIYYCNADAENRARSVGLYEMAVGLGGVAGPLTLGLLAWKDPESLRPYMGGSIFTLVAAAVVMWLMLSSSTRSLQRQAQES